MTERAPSMSRDEIYSLVDGRLTPVRLTLDRHEREIMQLQYAVFGDDRTHQRGLLRRIDHIDAQLSELISQRDAIINQVRGMRWAVIGLTVINVPGSIAAIKALLDVVAI